MSFTVSGFSRFARPLYSFSLIHLTLLTSITNKQQHFPLLCNHHFNNDVLVTFFERQYIYTAATFLFIGACTVPEIPGCTLLGETPQQISANHVLTFACGNSSNVTASGTTQMQCREDGIWESQIRGLRFSYIKHRQSVCTSCDVMCLTVSKTLIYTRTIILH